MVHVVVRDNDLDRAIRMFKRELQSDGFFRKMRLMRHHEKGAAKRLRKREESVRRLRKLQRRNQDRF